LVDKENEQMNNISEDKYHVEYNGDVRIVTAKFWDNCKHQLGTFMEDSDYDFLVEEDTDFYAPTDSGLTGASENGEHNIIFKYRKNIFTEDEQLGAYDGLVGAAQPTQNRGVAAGPKAATQGSRDWATEEQVEIMDYYINQTQSLFDEGDPIELIQQKHKNKESTSRGIVWLRSKITDAGYQYETFFADKMQEWKDMDPIKSQKDAKVVKETFISDTTYANAVNSGIAGFFDRYPRIPYGRATAYTEQNRETYSLCYPFMRKLANQFKELLPIRHHVQETVANNIDDRFRVAGKDTPFTTITVNKNFRTAAHYDAGDLHEGFSNLTVVAKDKAWEGGYLVLPEFKVAVNIRPGDLLLINNHGGIHGNTELKPPAGKKLEDMERVSLVCYFREKMSLLGSWEYENLRHQFVDDRRLNQEHPEWRKFWNGVSPSMWDTQEWYDYLEASAGKQMVEEYHPEAYEEKSSLEGFFS
jgi:hypothetical protein